MSYLCVSSIKYKIMKGLRYTVLLASAAMLAASPAHSRDRKIVASRNYVAKEVTAPQDFRILTVSHIVDVDYTQSTDGRTAIRIYGSDNLIDLVTLDYTGNGKLNVGLREGYRVEGESRLKVIASSPSLEEVGIHGTGDVTVKGPLDVPSLEVKLLGTGDFTAGQIVCDGDMSINIYGTGDFTAGKMECADFTAKTAGTGDITVGVLTCDAMTTSQSGTGDIDMDTVNCGSLHAGIYGTGDSDYGRMVCDGMEVSLAGTGDFQAHADCSGTVAVTTTSSGDITVSGKCATAELKTYSTGDIMAGRLVAENVIATAVGSGEIECHAAASIKAVCEGSGSIRYRGNPNFSSASGNHIHSIN